MLNRLKKLLRIKPKYVFDVRGLSIVEIDELVRKNKPDALSFGDGIEVGVMVSGNDVDDVKGEFLPDMSDDEVLDYERNERLGWKGFKLPWQNETTS